MMVHQDGSRHEWLAGQPPLDLIFTMDDATSEIYSAFFVEEEGTCQRRSKISPPGRSKTSPLNVMRYKVLGGCPGSP